jgi:DNA-binding LytR/AlgR family response regulator
MPNMNGFQLATILQEQYPDTLIIFVSAYDNFVYSCFEYSPFSFLRKTKIEAELPSVIKRAVEKSIVNEETLIFHTIDGDISIRLKDILYFEGEKNYYVIYCASGKNLRCRGTITTVTEMTIKYDFFKIHPAFVINLTHVESVLAPNSIRMRNGITLYISRSNLTAFKQAYMQYTRRRLTK